MYRLYRQLAQDGFGLGALFLKAELIIANCEHITMAQLCGAC